MHRELRAVDPHDDPVLGARHGAAGPGHHDDGALGVGAHREGGGAQQRAEDPSPSAGADDHEGRRRRGLLEREGTARQRGGRADVEVGVLGPGPLDAELGDLGGRGVGALRGPQPDGVVVGVADLVGGVEDHEDPSDAGGVRGGPVQGRLAVLGTVVAHADGAVGDVHHCSLPPVSPPASPGVAGPARVEGPLLSPPSGPSWQGGTVTAPSTPVRLTSYAAGGGCACKIPPGELAELVGGLALPVLPDVLVGTGDDAGVVRVAPDLAVVSTADFFTPLLDDPYDFGRVAAANALSDVYAMGGRPV